MTETQQGRFLESAYQGYLLQGYSKANAMDIAEQDLDDEINSFEHNLKETNEDF